MPAVMKDSLGWQGRNHNWLRQMMFLIWRTMYFNFPAQGLSWDTTYMRTVSCLFTGDKMQSSYIALREVLSVREERELPKWPTEPSGRAAGQWQQQASSGACRGTAPALQWHLAVPQDTRTRGAAIPRQQRRWARRSPAGICRDIFAARVAGGRRGGGQQGMGVVKYWYWFWGCGWLMHHGCEFRLIDTGCIDREMHPQGWVSPVISQGYLVPSATACLDNFTVSPAAVWDILVPTAAPGTCGRPKDRAPHLSKLDVCD